MNDIRDISHDEARVAELVRSARRVAVLGIKTEAQADQPAFYVPSYLQSAGVDPDRVYQVAGKATSEPLYPDDPMLPGNRRIAIVLLREAPVLPASPGL